MCQDKFAPDRWEFWRELPDPDDELHDEEKFIEETEHLNDCDEEDDKEAKVFRSKNYYLGEPNDSAIQVALPETLKLKFQEFTQREKISMSAKIVELILEKLK